MTAVLTRETDPKQILFNTNYIFAISFKVNVAVPQEIHFSQPSSCASSAVLNSTEAATTLIRPANLRIALLDH